jgi:hypothetical protein
LKPSCLITVPIRSILAEWWETVGGVQQKDATNDEAIDCGQGYEDSRDSRMGCCGAEEAAGIVILFQLSFPPRLDSWAERLVG